MSALRSFLKWARTVPRNAASLELRWRLGFRPFNPWPWRWFALKHKFDPGTPGYWFHFSYFTIQIMPVIFLWEFGLYDTN